MPTELYNKDGHKVVVFNDMVRGEDGVQGLSGATKDAIAGAKFVFGGKRHLALVDGLGGAERLRRRTRHQLRRHLQGRLSGQQLETRPGRDLHHDGTAGRPHGLARSP